MFSFGKAPLVGLDIGSTMLKAVALKKKRDGVFLDSAGTAPMPAGALSDGAFLDPPAIADCIRQLWRDQRLRSKRVALALAGEGVFLTRLKLERGASDLEAQVREEAARLAPFPLDEARLDYQVLDNFSDSCWVSALVVAARSRRVENLRDLATRAGKTPLVVDSTACALANAYEFNYEPAPSDVVALIHVGAAWMTVCVIRGSTPLLAQDLPLAPTEFTEEEWNLTDRIAVQLERVFEFMDEIADEHPLEPHSRQIRRLLLSGGGARLQGLDSVLRDRIQLPFQEMDPFRKIEFEGSGALSRLVQTHAHCMPVAVGLALRGLDEL